MTFKRIWKSSLAFMLILCNVVFMAPAAVAHASDKSLDYSLIFDANYYYDHYEDMQKAFGKNPLSLFNHFMTKGMKEGRQGCKNFNVFNYARNNLDLIVRYGNYDLSLYYMQYVTEGYEQGRNCSHPYDPDDDDDDDDDDVSDSTLAGYASTMASTINQLRLSKETDAFAISTSLTDAAKVRAKELINNYSHTRPNGMPYTDVLTQYNVSCKDSYEIISNNQATAGTLLSSWMSDPGIGATLNDKKFKYMGIGCAADSKGNIYWTVLVTY